MCPPRCDCSCGRCAGASSLPLNSSGERTSTRFFLPIASTTSSRNARMEVSWSLACVRRLVAGHRVLRQLAAVQFPLLAAAVEQLDLVVAVELEVPVRVRREPVVVAAVEHDGVVVADALLGQQLFELLLVDEVAADLVLQVGLPVELDGAGDMAAVVGGGVLVDLDEDHARGVQVFFGPIGRDEHVSAAHGGSLLGYRGGQQRRHMRARRIAGGRARSGATETAAHTAQVDRAAAIERDAHTDTLTARGNRSP